MGEGDHMPSGGGHRRQIDPKKIAKIKEGGKKADAIRQQADAHHEAEEVPKAEEELLKDLNKIPD